MISVISWKQPPAFRPFNRYEGPEVKGRIMDEILSVFLAAMVA